MTAPTVPTVERTDTSWLRQREVCQRFGISRSTLYRLMADGHFPSPVKLGRGLQRWSRTEIEALERRAIGDRIPRSLR